MLRAALACLALLALVAPARANLRVEITLKYQGERDFTYTVDVSSSESTDIESSPERALRKHVDEAKKKLAIRQGYSPAIYGADFVKMIRVERVLYKVTDTSTSRVIAETRRGSG